MQKEIKKNIFRLCIDMVNLLVDIPPQGMVYTAYKEMAPYRQAAKASANASISSFVTMRGA